MTISTNDQNALDVLQLLPDLVDTIAVNDSKDPFTDTQRINRNEYLGAGHFTARLQADLHITGLAFTHMLRGIAEAAVRYGGPTVAATGTFLTTPTEGEVVSGSQTIILTLTNDTWATDVITDAAKLAALRRGLIARDNEAAGWNVKIRAVITSTEVVRTSGTVVTITLPAAGTYAIDSDENVDIVIPKKCVAGSNPLYVATPIAIVAA